MLEQQIKDLRTELEDSQKEISLLKEELIKSKERNEEGKTEILMQYAFSTIASWQIASSPGQIFSLTERTNENGSAKKGPGMMVSIARATFDHSPESGESVHT